jgi:hypothetical protein
MYKKRDRFSKESGLFVHTKMASIPPLALPRSGMTVDNMSVILSAWLNQAPVLIKLSLIE